MKQKAILILFTVSGALIFSCTQNSKGSNTRICDSVAIAKQYTKDHPVESFQSSYTDVAADTISVATTSARILSSVAFNWIKNYSADPLDLYASPGVKLKSFEFSVEFLDQIKKIPEIRGFRCYLAKRTLPEDSNYTLVLVGTNENNRNILIDNDPNIPNDKREVAYAFDWHKPCPKCDADNDTWAGGLPK